MSMSHSPWAAMRSLTRDGEVAKRKLAPGTIPRIAALRPPLPAADRRLPGPRGARRLLVVALPLLFKVIVDEVSPGRTPAASRSSSTVALGVAGLAVVDAGLTLWQRYAVLPGR